MHARRPVVLAASALVAALALAGCSSSSDDASSKPSGGATSTAAAPSDAATKPADTSATELTADNFIETVAASMSKDASYHTTMKTTANGTEAMSADGDASVSGGNTSMAMKMTTQGVDMEVRVVDGIWYMNLGELSQDKFIKVDPNDAADEMGSSFAGLTDQLDPAATVSAMKDAVTSVKKSGEPVELDGVQAQPYEVVVDPSKIGGAFGEQIKKAGASLPDSFTYTYWVGSDGKPRKMVMDQAGAKTEMTMTDWGKKVVVKAPSKAEIIEMPTS
ncbi:LppX_LprAFG lipoprotein [Cellulomonas sp. HZM]|uniref:LppX_LprAFG lipoprotein n=1 Tax=Cellulomonas sp. HZM TaxID=1454010 RepID=UPI000492FD9B|nr:LppX_LprAFG lipoprotein [Cellulomonas sp. HZM]